jgi:hypothetical protein
MAVFPRKFSGKSASKAASRAAARSGKSRRLGAGLRLENLEQRVLLHGAGVASTAPATHFALWAPEGVTAGAAEPLVLVALDAANHVASNYAGTVHIASDDASAVLPDDYTFTTADHSRHLFQLTLNTVGAESVTATDTADSTITDSITLNVAPAPVATHFGVWAPENVSAGKTFGTVVVALDAANHPVWNYTGTVQLTSSDGDAVLPDSYTFTAADHGFHVFQTTLKTEGSQTVTATDTTTDTIVGSVTVNVNPAPVATHFAVLARENVTAGAQTSVVVVALDASNHVVPDYTGTVQLTADGDPDALLPDAYTFTADDHGRHVFQLTLNTTGSQAIVATDSATAAITGTVTVTVNPAPVATHFAVWADGNVTAGAPFNVVVVALDASNHVVPNYTGTVQLTADGDSSAVLPDAYTFTADDHGRHVFQVTLNTTGSQTISAADGSNPALTGTITVIVNAPPSTTGGGGFSGGFFHGPRLGGHDAFFAGFASAGRSFRRWR